MNNLRELRSTLQQMVEHLDNGIIPFWRERAQDQEFGGYYTNFDESGERKHMGEKCLSSQMRLVWWFSRLARVYPNQAHHQDLARWGVDFMVAHFWDEQHGGWYWKCARDGGVSDNGKVVYGQSFAIYAMAEYFLATGDPRGLQYACDTFDLLQKYGADTRWGGYYENLERDWSISAPGFHAGDRKSLDIHMHLMEAFTNLYEASKEALHRRKLIEIIDLIACKMVDTTNGCGLNQFDLAFNPIPAIAIRRTFNAERVGESPDKPIETTSFGHNVELVWLMRLALDVATVDHSPYRQVMAALLDQAATVGMDWEHGGIYRDGVRGGAALILEKEFWQQCESLVGFLDGYEQFGEARYLDAFLAIWRFAYKYHIVDRVGEWRILVGREGQPIDTDVGNEWKVSYHTGRSMLECVHRLTKILNKNERDGGDSLLP